MSHSHKVLQRLGADRLVSREEGAVAVQTDDLTGSHLDHRRSGIAAKRRAVVEYSTALCANKFAGREALDAEFATKNRVDE